VAVNALWPRTLIATAALQAIDGQAAGEMAARGRHPDIMADAALLILSQPLSYTGTSFVKSGVYNGGLCMYVGNFCIDEHILLDSEPATDLRKYSVRSDLPLSALQEDFFIDASYRTPPLHTKMPTVLSKL
jgi:citronellol/citronellal dehydrogenase